MQVTVDCLQQHDGAAWGHGATGSAPAWHAGGLRVRAPLTPRAISVKKKKEEQMYSNGNSFGVERENSTQACEPKILFPPLIREQM